MKQITLRSIPPDIEKVIKKESRRKNLSINKTIIALLEKTVGVQKRKAAKSAVYHDLDELSGAWSKTEAKEFEKHLKDQRSIDEDVWK